MKRAVLFAAALFFANSVFGQTTTCPTGSISLTAPANGATVSSPVTFSWTPINGSIAYRLWLSLEGATPALINRTSSTTSTHALPSGSGEWYVEALFANNCPSIFSQRFKITIRPATTCGSNPIPTLVSPIGSAAQPATAKSPVDFIWNASPGAIGYDVLVAPFGSTAFADLGLTKDTRFQRLLEPGTYIWFVVALFEGCPAVRSEMSIFRIDQTVTRCSITAPAILAPADNATNVSSPVTMSWSSVPNAVTYRIAASVGGSEPFLLAETSETSIIRPLPPALVFWSVEATLRNCPSTRSPVARFTIGRSANCAGQRPQNVSPANETEVGSAVIFSWTPVPGALRYVVIVRGNDGEPTPIGETDTTQLARLLPAAGIEWWVVALLPGCDPVQSDHSRFTVVIPAACETRRPILLTPVDDALGVTSPTRFSWTPVRGARLYRVFAAIADKEPTVIAASTTPEAIGNIPAGRVRWYVEAAVDGCPPMLSGVREFLVTPRNTQCRTPDKPTAHVTGQVLSGTDFKVRWTPIQNASGYELQESGTADFANAATQVIADDSGTFTRSASAPTGYYYRVRALSSCSDDRGPYSDVVRIIVLPPDAAKPRASAEVGTQQNIVQTLFVPGSTSTMTFSARSERSWLIVTPSSGTIPPQGITLTLTVDPNRLFLGANTGIVRLTYAGGGKGQTGHANPPASSTVSVSLVTPVTPGGKNTPPPDALIIPAVGHAAGANNSQFESDVRVVNNSTQPMTYQLNFTPSGVDGTVTGSSTMIEVDPGATAALNDILASFFGTAPSESATGMLEIRPLTSSSTSSAFTGTSSKLVTVASSRTYNATATGTFGQYIPAIPFSKFAGKSQILSLQQIAESSAYRTNFGLVEASGEAAEGVMRVYDRVSRLIAEIPFSLAAAQHLQFNRLLATNGITLDEGRVEVEVTSSTGKVSAYASTIDNVSGDPLLVPPVLKSAASGTRYVLPGIAFMNGLAAWRSDVRLFNTAASPVNATIAYFPQGAISAANTTTVSIAAGEVKSYDNILNSLFGINDTPGGSLLVTTASSSSIIASARTYAQTDAGTYGQFIPGVTPADSVGRGERALNILQLEQSDNFRTNVGLVETTGNAATAEVTLILPDSKVTPKVPIALPANGFFQFPLSSFGITDAIFNARITVKVISGNGKVSAYGSVIDNLSKDPTYVPAQ